MYGLFTKESLRGDLIGGLSAGIVTLPVALAYGVASGLGPVAGMISAIVLGLLSSIFGGTNTQISSPTGAMTVVVALICVAEIKLAGDLQHAIPVLVLIFSLSGIFQVLMGIFKVGANIRYVPYPVVSGFMSGIGVIIMILQVKDIFGVYDASYGSAVEIMTHFDYFLVHINWASLSVTVFTLLIIALLPRVDKRIPGGLVALIVVSVLVEFLQLPVEMLGEVNVEFAHFNLSHFKGLWTPETLLRVAFSAISLSLLGSINTLLTSVVADKMTHTLHDSNRELIGQGIGNLFSGLLGGFPGSGATACTVANIKAGGRHRISGVFSSMFLILVFLFGMNVAAHIPKAVLGAILVHIGFILIDIKTLRNLSAIGKADNLIMLTVLVLTVTWNLVFAVLIGLVMASFHFMKRMSDVVEQDTQRTRVDELVSETIERFNDKIIRSLIQLFAILADMKATNEKGRIVVERFLRSRVAAERIKGYLDSYDSLLDDRLKVTDKNGSQRKKTSMNSVKVLKICTLINNDLEREEKFYLLIRLAEFVNADQDASEQEWDFVHVVAEVFGLSNEELILAKYLASSDLRVDKHEDAALRDAQSFESSVLIKNIKGPVFFGFSHRFLVSMRNIAPEIKVVVLNMAFVPFMDHSGVRTFMEVATFLSNKGVQVCFSGLSERNLALLKGAGVIPQLVKNDHVFDTIQNCIIWLNQPGAARLNIRDEDALYPSPIFQIDDAGLQYWNISKIDQLPYAIVSIYDMQDIEVYSSKGYNPPWKGMYQEHPLPEGRYKYEIRSSEKDVMIKEGYVILLRKSQS